jgi:putative hemolysin
MLTDQDPAPGQTGLPDAVKGKPRLPFGKGQKPPIKLQALKDKLKRNSRPKLDGQTARDISYSYAAQTKAGRTLIRSIENLTGRPRLIRLARGYDLEVEQGRDFWEVIQERYAINMVLEEGALERIPESGPVVVVANHPFGILDGLAMGRLLSSRRPDFKIMAHKVFHKAKDLKDVILPISFDGTKEAMEANLETRKHALDYLLGGGCIGIFPGGTVSTSSKLFNRAMDPAWKTFTARMIQRSGATVVPVYFSGQNSRLFHIASHCHATLRTALLINEFNRCVGGSLPVMIGEALPAEEIAGFKGDAKALMDHLRIATYKLAPEPLPDYEYGLNLD